MKDVEQPEGDTEVPKLWGELARTCRRIHFHWHEMNDRTAARRYLGRLDRILAKLPPDNVAIVRQEALAWSALMHGRKAAAIKHRKREVRQMRRLHEDVRRNLASGKYNEVTARYALTNRDLSVLQQRLRMLKELEDEATLETDEG